MQKNIKVGNNTLSIIPGKLQKGALGVPFYLCGTIYFNRVTSYILTYTERVEPPEEEDNRSFAFVFDSQNNLIQRIEPKHFDSWYKNVLQKIT